MHRFYADTVDTCVSREKKKKGGKVDAKKSGGDKDRKRESVNESFKSKEFISSEESSSESDHRKGGKGGKGSKRKVCDGRVCFYWRF